jgi:hypothetical protein
MTYKTLTNWLSKMPSLASNSNKGTPNPKLKLWTPKYCSGVQSFSFGKMNDDESSTNI